MTKKRETAITQISREAWKIAERLAISVLNLPLPVPLAVIAKALGVRCIRFDPLISDVGLAKSSEGFDIVVNTEAPGVTETAGTTYSVDDDKWNGLGSSLRFSVAHELAHLPFLIGAGQDRFADVFRRNEQAVEKGSSILARALLLPRKVLVRELGNRLLDVDHISSLLHVFRVSPEVLIRRLHLPDMKAQRTDLDGVLGFAQEKESRVRIKACHVLGTYATERFHEALKRAQRKTKQTTKYPSLSAEYAEAKWCLEGCALNDLKLDAHKDIESLLRSNERGRLDLQVGWAAGDIIPCDLTFLRIHQRPLGLLVRIQVTGPVQKPGQKTLF